MPTLLAIVIVVLALLLQPTAKCSLCTEIHTLRRLDMTLGIFLIGEYLNFPSTVLSLGLIPGSWTRRDGKTTVLTNLEALPDNRARDVLLRVWPDHEPAHLAAVRVPRRQRPKRFPLRELDAGRPAGTVLGGKLRAELHTQTARTRGQ